MEENMKGEVLHKADQIIDWLKVEIREAFPDYDDDQVRSLMLSAIKRARALIEREVQK